VATPILGRVGDMIGKDRALLVVLGAIALGSLVSALAPNLAVVIVGRVVQGLGGAIYPIAFGILRDEVEPGRVPSAIGAMSSVVAVGGGIGTVLAGPITEALGWRALFWIPLVVVVVVALLCRRFVPESPVRSRGRIHWVGSTLLATWLVALLLPVSQGRAWGWGAPVTLALLGVAVAAFVA
jgi:MFS family permease